MAYQVKLPIFEGPLDLLLTLVEEEKLPITEVALSQVADQYLDYVAALPEIDLKYCTQFLTYAVTLFQLKVAALLPPPLVDEEEALVDPEEEQQLLVARLIEYRMFKRLAQELRKHAATVAGTFSRPYATVPRAKPKPLEGIGVERLVAAYVQVIRAQEEREEVLRPVRGKLDLGRRIVEIYRRLRKVKRTSFFQLAGGGQEPLEKLGVFLALLELTVRGRIRLEQPEPFADIEVSLVVPTEEGQ